MAIDITPYLAPLNTAADKLKVNGGSASQLKGDLDKASSALSDSGSKASGDAGKLSAEWQGGKGTTFEGKAGAAPKELNAAASDAAGISKMIGDALHTVQQAHTEVMQLRDEFNGKAQAIANAAGDDPNLQAQAKALLSAESAQYAHAAAQIVNSAKSALSQSAGNPGSTATQSSGPSNAGNIGSRTGGGGGGGGGGGAGGTSAQSSGQAVMVPPPKNNYNDGTTTVQLPDGKTVQAPNPRAAAAVRAALSRKGLPYVWGGTDPNKGMDCSGLTQWAYGQAGIKLPRTAHTQTVGQKVDISDIAPGDLLIWSGHVAMYIGNGQIIEEPQPGETCHIRPMRTDNCGEPFYGVFRPSA